MSRERTAATDQDEQILLELRASARDDFNLQPRQSKSGLVEEAADRGDGPEVRCIKPLRARR